LRTADAAGVDGVIVCSNGLASTDLHNPNVVRASLGTLFTVPVAAATTSETITWLQEKQIQIVVATPEAEKVYTAVHLQAPIALVTGSEAYGLSPAWLSAADERVKIPMHGAADSLNLATATALLLYEVVRQRS
jgi:TrmH family RNA methyltransferase